MNLKAVLLGFYVLLILSVISLLIYKEKLNEKSIAVGKLNVSYDVVHEHGDYNSVQQKKKNYYSSYAQDAGSYEQFLGDRPYNNSNSSSNHNYNTNDQGKQNNNNNNNQGKKTSDAEWKMILFWTICFNGKWGDIYEHLSPEELRNAGCPSWRCNFTSDKNDIKNADAVLFTSIQFNTDGIPKYRSSNQRWVWTSLEAPGNGGDLGSIELNRIKNQKSSSLINWTMSFHPNSDIMNGYGYFVSRKEQKVIIRPRLMSSHHLDMRRYKEALRNNVTLEDIMGSTWRLLTNRPKLVSWMSSHCNAQSKRDDYITELSKYIRVDKYGNCGNITCRPKHPSTKCWESVLGQQYLFYLAFENHLCDYYATEKLDRALLYNLVPVVWGGKTYDKILPPGSYIDARNYHPKDLAKLLLSLQKDQVAYGRYHLWRGFWEVRLKGSFCELCHKLHTDKEPKHYQDMTTFRRNNTRCLKTPKSLFSDKNNPDAWKEVITPLK